MKSKYQITPTIEHLGCIVDALGRVGRLEEAEKFIMSTKDKANTHMWLSLLSTCRFHNDVERAERVAQIVQDLDPQNAASYVLLANIYGAVGRWNDQER
jgi:hypothetical protein